MQKDLHIKQILLTGSQIYNYPITTQKVPQKHTTAITKVRKMSRYDLLVKSMKSEEHKIRLIANYNPMNPDLKAIIKKYEGLLALTKNQKQSCLNIYKLLITEIPTSRTSWFSHQLTRNPHTGYVNHVSPQDVRLANIWIQPKWLLTMTISAIPSEETSHAIHIM